MHCQCGIKESHHEGNIIIILSLLFVLSGCSIKTNNNDAFKEEDVSWDLRPMLMYEDEISYYIEDKSEVISDETIFDGCIESEIESSKRRKL